MKDGKKKDEKMSYSCVDCMVGNCDTMKKAYPEFCLTTKMDQDILKKAMSYYEVPENQKIAIAAANVEYDYYCKLTRIEEIAEFARNMEFKKLGIATCVGLLKEARVAAKILRKKGYEVYGVACKAGAEPKTNVGIDEKCESIGVNMCNPILQAQLLNKEKTDLNILIGLCVGHDSLFVKYSESIVTTLIAKDRVLGHNPAAALYLSDTYYSKLCR